MRTLLAWSRAAWRAVLRGMGRQPAEAAAEDRWTRAARRACQGYREHLGWIPGRWPAAEVYKELVAAAVDDAGIYARALLAGHVLAPEAAARGGDATPLGPLPVEARFAMLRLLHAFLDEGAARRSLESMSDGKAADLFLDDVAPALQRLAASDCFDPHGVRVDAWYVEGDEDGVCTHLRLCLTRLPATSLGVAARTRRRRARECVGTIVDRRPRIEIEAPPTGGTRANVHAKPTNEQLEEAILERRRIDADAALAEQRRREEAEAEAVERRRRRWRWRWGFAVAAAVAGVGTALAAWAHSPYETAATVALASFLGGLVAFLVCIVGESFLAPLDR